MEKVNLQDKIVKFLCYVRVVFVYRYLGKALDSNGKICFEGEIKEGIRTGKCRKHFFNHHLLIVLRSSKSNCLKYFSSGIQ